MQLGWLEHFQNIVVPAWQAYRVAESRLTEAHAAADPAAIQAAQFTALREGGAACFYLHHFADIASAEQALGELSLRDVRAKLGGACLYLRGDKPCDDVSLLADVTDALKHAQLTRQPGRRAVAARDAVMVLSTGYGKVPFGEGKYGGVEQVIILTTTGIRCLSTILQNVIDAWRRLLGFDIPAIGQP